MEHQNLKRSLIEAPSNEGETKKCDQRKTAKGAARPLDPTLWLDVAIAALLCVITFAVADQSGFVPLALWFAAVQLGLLSALPRNSVRILNVAAPVAICVGATAHLMSTNL